MTAGTGHDVRAVADAVLYEGYLLYPYRSTSSKNQSRWQFGVLGPVGAAGRAVGEDSSMSAQLLAVTDGDASLSVTLRCLQLQRRDIQSRTGSGYASVPELVEGANTWIGWDEAVECETTLGPFDLATLVDPVSVPVTFSGGSETEELSTGRIVRSRSALHALVQLSAVETNGVVEIGIAVRNTGQLAPDDGADEAIRLSLIGAHQIVDLAGGTFVSLLEPPDRFSSAAGARTHHRCFPVLAGAPGALDTVLISPIILYDYPEVAEQSPGALFDSTEIDEILSLRVMTLTEEEKAQARATDPRAAEIIDRCESMSPEDLRQLHGVLRDPRAGIDTGPGSHLPDLDSEIPWWTEEAEGQVQPEVDFVLVDDVRIAKGSIVRLHPSRRADAHDLFYAGQLARVTAVHADVDGETHVAVVLVDDPAGELHEWYGRYLYFAPDEVEPVRQGKEGSP